MASTTLRRSSAKLLNMGSVHKDLQLLIHQLKESRELYKRLHSTQTNMMSDLVKWSEGEDNRALKDTVIHISDMYALYLETQRDLSEGLKEFRKQFEVILEKERNVETAKGKLDAAKTKESKYCEQLSKAQKKAVTSQEQLRHVLMKKDQAEQERKAAQTELDQAVQDGECIKAIRFKSGILKWCQSHMSQSQKTNIIFSGIVDVAKLIPDVEGDGQVQGIPYTGAATAVRISLDTKGKIDNFKGAYAELPPPYCTIQPPENPFYHSLAGSTMREANSLQNISDPSHMEYSFVNEQARQRRSDLGPWTVPGIPHRANLAP